MTIASVIDCRHYGFFWLLIKLISDFDVKSGAFLAGTAVERQDLPRTRPPRCPWPMLSARINLSAQGGVNPLPLKTPRLSDEASTWVKPLAAPRSAALVAAPAVQVECSGSCNSGGKGPTNS